MAKTLKIKNPATFEPLGEVDIATPEEVDTSVERAIIAAKSWSRLSYPERARYIYRVRDVICRNKESRTHRQRG